MDRSVIYAAIILVLAFLALNVLESMIEEEPLEGVCLIPSDCEGLPPGECEGRWECVKNFCTWECKTGDAGAENSSEEPEGP